MKKLFLLLPVLLILVACSSKPDGYVISGIVKGGKGKTLFLSSMSKIDSVVIDSEDKFRFTGKLTEADFLNLYFDRGNPILLFIDSTEQVTINTDYELFSRKYSVTGSSTSEQIRILQQELFTTFDAIQTLFDEKMKGADSTNVDSLKIIANNESNKILQAHRQKILDFIKQNPTSFACLPAIYQALDSRTPLFRYELDAPYFKFLDSTLMAVSPNSKHTKEFHAQLIQFQQQYERIQKPQQGGMQTGTKAPDFEVPGINGGTIKLSDFKGKYVLLDFWAAWCTPCRHENPNLEAAYKIFKSKKFDIFQVSLDKTRGDWAAAIEKDGIGAWKHGSDLQYWNSAPAKLYGIQSIPSNFLIDPEGNIIAINLRGEALETKLKEIFN